MSDIFNSNDYDVIQFWNSSAYGGGNHSEEYMSIFKAGNKSNHPNYVIFIADDLTRYLEPIIKDVKIDSNNVIALPGMGKNATDSHASFSNPIYDIFVICKDNSLLPLVYVGTIDRDKYGTEIDSSTLNYYLGISNYEAEQFHLDKESAPWAKAGVVPGNSYWFYKIQGFSGKAISKQLNLAVGDYLISVDGKAMQSGDADSEYGCRVGDGSTKNFREVTSIEHTLYVWKKNATEPVAVRYSVWRDDVQLVDEPPQQ